MTTDRVAWLTACYDRAEQRARAVTEHQPLDEWTAVGARGDTDIDNSYWSVVKVARPYPTPAAKAIAEHIAELDPSWRLAEIARHRAILAIHRTEPDDANRHWRMPARACVGCGWDQYEEAAVEDINGCPVVRLLAEEFAGEPGYAEMWGSGGR